MDGLARTHRFPKPDRFGGKRVQIRKQQDAQSVVGWAVTNFSELCDWIPAGNRRPGSQSDNLHKIRMTYSSEYEQFAQRLALCKMTEKNWPIGGPMRKTVHLLGRCWASSRESSENRSECEWPPLSEAGHASRGEKTGKPDGCGLFGLLQPPGGFCSGSGHASMESLDFQNL